MINIKLASTVQFDKSLYSIPASLTIKLCKKVGFTLAETLITLTIIGVIAAITVPTLMTNYQKQTYTIGLKKAYSQLQNAVKMMPMTEGCSMGDYECIAPNTHWRIEEAKLLAKHFKVARGPFSENDPLCAKIQDGPAACFQTDDGMIFSSTHGTVSVDINGTKGPNKSGRDQFMFLIPALSGGDFYRGYVCPNLKDNQLGTVIPVGSVLSKDVASEYWSKYWKENNNCTSSNLTRFCTGRVLEEGKMNY